MMRPRRSWILLAIGGLVAVLLLSRQMSQRRLDRAIESFLDHSRTAGVEFTLGPPTTTLFERRYSDNRFTFPGHPKLRGTASEVTISGFPWANRCLSISGISADVEGEPYELFRILRPLHERFPKDVNVGPMNVRYRHPVLGKLELDTVAVLATEPTWVLSVGTTRLGARVYRDAVVGVFERQDFFEFSLGTSTMNDARFRLAQYGSPARGSTWNLQLVHQGLPDLLEALEWRHVAGLENTSVVGQLTLVHSSSNDTLRGSLQLTFDQFPQPSFRESEAILGRSASLFLRLARTGKEGFTFDAPYVEGNSSLFTLHGTGRLSLFGEHSSLAFDVRGQSPCSLLASQLPPSGYRAQLEATLAEPAKPRISTPQQTSLPLRIQLEATSTAEDTRNLALELGAGCGIEAQTVGTFRSLALPRFEPRTRQAVNTAR
jgi:hypothetical protein